MQYLYADELFTLSLGSFLIPDKLLERVKRAFRSAAKFIHSKGSYYPDMLAEKPLKELLYSTYDSLSDAVNIGLKKSDMPAVMRLHLQDNTFMFSGFKTHTQMQQASRLLLDDDKNIKPFNRFLKDVQTIDKTYNGSYLQAEYNFAVHSAQSAAQWQDFVADADDFYLRYRTAGDERVREQHRLLDGITLPVEDKFWDEFFPPNGWNCRCSVIQVPKHSATPSSSSEAIAKGRSATYLPNSKGENKAKIFRFNPGKEQKIFPPKHPYFPKGCGDCNLNKYAHTTDANTKCKPCNKVYQTSLSAYDIEVLKKLHPTTIHAQNLGTKNLQINQETAERYLYHATKKDAKDLILTIAKDIETLKPKGYSKLKYVKGKSIKTFKKKKKRGVYGYATYEYKKNGKKYIIGMECIKKDGIKFETPYFVALK